MKALSPLSKHLTLFLCALLVTFTSGSVLAQDTDNTAGAANASETGDDADSIDYFFRELDSDGHPWHRSATESPHGGDSKWNIWTGPRNSYIRGTLKAEIAYYNQGSSWFGEAEANLGGNSSDWYETAIHPGFQGSYFFADKGEMYGRLSFLNSSTDDVDAAGSNLPESADASDTTLEDAVIGWRSGDMWPSLGKDFLDVSFGRQQYTAGTGFILSDQGSDGGNRGAFWIGERHAADYAGIVKVKWRNWTADLVHFNANDNPDSDTKVTGTTIDYDFGDFGSVGGGYYSIDSDISTRDGMDVFDIRFQTTPFAAFDTPAVLHPIEFDGEYVNEDNGDELDASGWYVSAGYSWENAAWKPTATYRYASFEGDDPDSSKSEDFDPLFYGFYDWGTWFQGEILGEYVLLNSNLESHMFRVGADPYDSVHVNLIYYIFSLDDAEGFGVQSDDFADEFNVTVDWTINDSVSVSLVGAWVSPDDGAEEFSGGNDDWSYGMLYVSYSFN